MTYFLAFDHRNSFLQLIGTALSSAESLPERARECKQVIYEGFLQANGNPPSQGIIVDTDLGGKLLRDAAARGFLTAFPLEKPDQDIFCLEREDWQGLLQEYPQAHAKVLVRYNPEGNPDANQIQRQRLADISEHLQQTGRKLLCEVLVPSTPEQMKVAGSKEAYQYYFLPELQRRAVQELQEAGVAPQVWKVEGLDSLMNWKLLSAEARSVNPQAEILVLGAGESPERVDRWLQIAARQETATGFAVGRTIFQEPLLHYLSGHISREQTAGTIACNYSHFCQVWERARENLPPASSVQESKT